MDLPLDLLRAFAAVAELGSVTRAAERVGRTQPALTLQIRRLEALLGRELFHRQGRRLVLAPAGSALLAHARPLLEMNDRAVAALAAEPVSGPLRVGMVQDFADSLLPGALAGFARTHPLVRLDVRVGGSAILRRQMEDGALDLALCVAGPGEAPLLARPMRWWGHADLAAQDPLPLVLLDAPCAFREAALAALAQAGQAWRVAVSTPSLSALRAAVLAGLGITCRVDLAMAGVPAISGLPALPLAGFTLLGGDTPPAAALAAILRKSLAS